MATRVTNIQQLTRDAIAQAMGANYYPDSGTSENKDLAEIDTYQLPDVGKDVDEADKVDVFTRALVVRIGKVSCDNRKLPYLDSGILKDNFEYGGAVESIRLGYYEVQDDPSWNLENGKSYADYDYTYHQPPVSVRLFDDRKAIYIAKSITRRQLKEAFLSWDSMSQFINAIAVAWDNTITMTINAWTRMLFASAIAVSDKATGTARHLVTEAVAKGLLTNGATADDFMESTACMLYAFEEMRNCKSFMTKDSTVAFNDKTLPCFTPSEDYRLTILTQFASKIKSIKANTYNDDQLGFGDYNEITSWQGISVSDSGVQSFYDFATNSSIKIKADAKNKLGIGTSVYNKSNVIGLSWDYLSMGVCPQERYVTSNYVAGADFWNDHGHYTANYWLDSRYNIVAWILD